MHNLVVGDGVEEVVVARVEHRVAHAAEDSKHGSTAVLDLNIEGTVTGINVLDLSRVASRDERRGAVVTSRKVLGSSGVLAGGHGNSLGKEAEESDLGKSKGRNLGKSRETHAIIKDGRERNISGQVEGSREGDAELLDHHTDEGGHGNTSVLDLNGTTAGERVGVLNKTEGIEKIERSGVDTKTVGRASISSDGSVDASLLNGSEGGGGADEGEGGNSLHDFNFFSWNCANTTYIQVEE
mmetsp:Transcript_14800/g.33402  ORF Transcript_14800/g.33402 Transcript_14800/m.33402 type:complete len:240 (-) Transcript_14800:308-1027(-)